MFCLTCALRHPPIGDRGADDRRRARATRRTPGSRRAAPGRSARRGRSTAPVVGSAAGVKRLHRSCPPPPTCPPIGVSSVSFHSVPGSWPLRTASIARCASRRRTARAPAAGRNRADRRPGRPAPTGSRSRNSRRARSSIPRSMTRGEVLRPLAAWRRHVAFSR